MTRVATLTRAATTKVTEASSALTTSIAADTAAAPTVEVKTASDAVQEAQIALEEVAKTETPAPEVLATAQTKVTEAKNAVAAATSTTADPVQKAELVKVESSLQAAKQMVSDAIAKSDDTTTASLTRVATTKMGEASAAATVALKGDNTVESKQATAAIDDAQTALESVAATTAPTASHLEAVEAKVAAAGVAIASAGQNATPARKAELVKIESSLVAAQQIVADAVAKAGASVGI